MEQEQEQEQEQELKSKLKTKPQSKPQRAGRQKQKQEPKSKPRPARNADDPEPAERTRPSATLYVPVWPGTLGCRIRLFRTPVGDRTAVAFTSERTLVAALGACHPWVTLGEPAVHALTDPLGVTGLTLDPQFAAPAVTTSTGGRALVRADRARVRADGTPRCPVREGPVPGGPVRPAPVGAERVPGAGPWSAKPPRGAAPFASTRLAG
ncbi:SAV_915 family protein [Streptomyces tsukubensis]|uniref:SseB protein N-terminal domain-containing protein n=1 Tax=Streptomyces tsukubensis TaxID=83656 RepID=A0A1V3ZY89_9ACTN|nr:hypothetical protein B1H18_34220 [Streptomyces tsukubensis]